MKKEISSKKLLFFSFVFYFFLLISEIINNAFNFILKYSEGKVGTSIISRFNECLSFLKFDIAEYTITLILIYIFFAFLNFLYVENVSLAFGSMGVKNNKILLFFLINVIFIFNIYVLNYINYPFSEISGFFAGIVTSGNVHNIKTFCLIILSIYFLGFFIVTFKHIKKFSVLASWLILVIIFISFIHPQYVVHKILHAADNKTDNNSSPNVIIIGIDSLNPEHTGYFGYDRNTSPNLDKFMEENIVFSNCYTSLARTFPSWYSILSGQYPKTNGARYNLIKREFLNPETKTMPEILRKEDNYFTAHFTDETRFSNITNDDGFVYLRHPIMGIKDFILGTIHDFSLTNVFLNNALGYKLFDFLEINRAVYHLYNPTYFTNEIVSYIDNLKEKDKFFLAVHLCAPHWPYASSFPYSYLYAEENNLFNEYDAAIRMADDQLGRILQALKDNNLYDDSIIVLLSDHGESYEGHGFDLEQSEQNHVLLAFKPLKNRKNMDINQLVRNIDIAPTIFHLLGKDWEHYEFEGVSLLPLINGNPEQWEEQNIFMETGFSFDVPGGVGLALQEMIEEGIYFYEFDERGIITVKKEFHQQLIERKQRAIQTNKWKLIFNNYVRKNSVKHKLALYDMKNDPECGNDCSEQNFQVTLELWKKLKSFYRDEIKHIFPGEENKR